MDLRVDAAAGDGRGDHRPLAEGDGARGGTGTEASAVAAVDAPADGRPEEGASGEEPHEGAARGEGREKAGRQGERRERGEKGGSGEPGEPGERGEGKEGGRAGSDEAGGPGESRESRESEEPEGLGRRSAAGGSSRQGEPGGRKSKGGRGERPEQRAKDARARGEDADGRGKDAPERGKDAPERGKDADGRRKKFGGRGKDADPGRGTGVDPSDRTDGGSPSRADAAGAWDDGLIARRADETAAAPQFPVAERRGSESQDMTPLVYDRTLRARLDALRELVGLSRTRLDSKTLAEAGRVLDEAAARRRLSGRHTVVAIAGATGSGKSQLFNALAGVPISETGVRRPTTAAPIACSWSDGAASLIDRLGIPPRLRRRPFQNGEADTQLRGLVLIDLPDHDSAAVQHREQVDRVLGLVDAVIWVVDPEKYADAMLHERYLRPLAAHAEVMFVVLNQVDRLPGEAAEQVLDDLRRLLDEDGIALGEYGEPGTAVLALSALTGDGVGELREALGQFVMERGAPARRLSADVDVAAARLWPVYANRGRTGLSEEAREEFSARLADAVGATAAGEAAERAWLRNANRACGTPWLRLWRWYEGRSEPATGRVPSRAPADEQVTARQRVEQAVRTMADRASAGLPAPWAQAVREAAVRGSQGLPEALDELAERAGLPPGRPPRPGWWPVAVLAQASMTILQFVGGLWLLGQIIGLMAPNLGVPVLLMVIGIVGGPLIEWSCRMAARGPARRYGQDAERRLREAAAGCGRARVLDPVAAELLRYREVREQYGRVIGAGAAGVR
ncbi:GTP-binding protein [Streptomyces sp. NPDC085946]|uniref:GTP-binding protein n=1 Tax=Streptomyces sp. NPDC085946 TaxID=3365744 RepID=UPI0037D4081B